MQHHRSVLGVAAFEAVLAQRDRGPVQVQVETNGGIFTGAGMIV
jgi:hypothetical protein